MEIIFLVLLLLAVLSRCLLWFGSCLSGFLMTLVVCRDTNISLTTRMTFWIIGILTALMPMWFHYFTMPIFAFIDLILKSMKIKSMVGFVFATCVLAWASSLVRDVIREWLPFGEESIDYTGDWSSNFGLALGTLIGLLYFPYYYDGSENDGRRSWTWFRSLRCWRLVHAYFGLDFELKNENETMRLMKEGPVIYSIHPHGLWPVSGPVGAGTHAGKIDFELLMAITGLIFWIPFFRDFVLWCGGVNASRSTLQKLLEQKKSIGLASGGVQEAILSNVDRLDLYLEHEGFLKLCWENEVPLLPTFARGENRIFLTLDLWPSFRKKCGHVLGYPLPAVFLGPWMTDLRIFVGEPILPRKETGTYENFKKRYYSELFSLIRDNETHEISEHLRKEMEKVLD